MATEGELTKDHWWWRPGWRLGRSFYTWHLTFQSSQAMKDIVATFAPSLSKFDTLDVVPPNGIHVTCQGLGFADEVSNGDVERIVSAVRSRCAGSGSIQIEFDAPHVDAETVQMSVGPLGRLNDLRGTIRSGIAEVWGSENVPESGTGFHPHITLAYSKGVRSVLEIEREIAAVPLPAQTCEIQSISLIQLNRDNRRYEWDDIATVAL